MKKLIIIGAGASGVFLAANFNHHEWTVQVLEQQKSPLKKLIISGGGRCNVTHACFDIYELVKNYPRGHKALLSIFSRFSPRETMDWFANQGIKLKIEADNRVFPVSDSSQTIKDVLIQEALKNKTNFHYQTTVIKLEKKENTFYVHTNHGVEKADAVVMACGSSHKMWSLLADLGHTVIPPVPSLFTFICDDPLLQGLQGTAFTDCELTIPNLKLKTTGPLLITHSGLSGPAVLKMSAWGAVALAQLNYQFDLKINWVGLSPEVLRELILAEKTAHPKKHMSNGKIAMLTQKFWKNVLRLLELEHLVWADLSKTQLNCIIELLCHSNLKVRGKNTFKEEFVTAGGVDLTEVDFKTMSSRLIPNLYFSGEVLNIDAITGGFNFQACWSEAFVISQQFNPSSKQ